MSTVHTSTFSSHKPEQESTSRVRHRYMTFHRLARSSNAELDKIFAKGIQPDLELLEGWEFRGWNVSPVTKVLGFQKFKKGFFRESGSHRSDQLFGYNVVVRQNELSFPHLAQPNELEPKCHGFYLVTPVDTSSRDNFYTNALLLDYGQGPSNPLWDPSSVLRDYLVQVEPENPDLFLGKAYLALGPARVFSNYFVLERYNPRGR
ncbi:MAG: hypothetical protein EP343_11765 [Deltaproteobacteria bacterium]|nr:MAG: hypothetical protein EP343_11765 [Deltaproteobacteria bacterium]